MTQNKGDYAFQGHSVTDIGTNRNPVCDFLLVIMTSYLVLFRSDRRLLFKFWTKNGHLNAFSTPVWRA